MIKFDFTSHFIIVLCLMVILVSTLIIFRKFKMGYGAFYVICPRASVQSICYATGVFALRFGEIRTRAWTEFVGGY